VSRVECGREQRRERVPVRRDERQLGQHRGAETLGQCALRQLRHARFELGSQPQVEREYKLFVTREEEARVFERAARRRGRLLQERAREPLLR
jgi:hypothetical protein